MLITAFDPPKVITYSERKDWGAFHHGGYIIRKQHGVWAWSVVQHEGEIRAALTYLREIYVCRTFHKAFAESTSLAFPLFNAGMYGVSHRTRGGWKGRIERLTGDTRDTYSFDAIWAYLLNGLVESDYWLAQMNYLEPRYASRQRMLKSELTRGAPYDLLLEHFHPVLQEVIHVD
jgi:hypothetical protein